MLELLGSFIGTVMIALLFHAPKKSILLCGLIGMFGYGVFLGVRAGLHNALAAYFLATCVLSALSEAMARRRKEPATIFMCVSILPLIPGQGLYETIASLVDKNYQAFLEKGTDTLLVVVTICAAIALTTQIYRIFSRRPQPPR